LKAYLFAGLHDSIKQSSGLVGGAQGGRRFRKRPGGSGSRFFNAAVERRWFVDS
jgi:hypothetical protein